MDRGMREHLDGSGHSLLPGFSVGHWQPGALLQQGLGWAPGLDVFPGRGELVGCSLLREGGSLAAVPCWIPWSCSVHGILFFPGQECGMRPRLLWERRWLERELLPGAGVGINTWILRSCARQGDQEHSLGAAGTEPCPQGNPCPALAVPGSGQTRPWRPWIGIPAGAAAPRPGAAARLGCQGASRNASLHRGTAGTQIRH